MNRLTSDKRAMILRCLVEGNSLRSTSRMTGTMLNTVIKLLCEVGESANAYQSKAMVNLPCKLLQLDEVWSFVGCKDKTKPKAKGKHPGDIWTWSGLCADTKLIPGYFVGDRSAVSAYEFCSDLGKRFSGQVQITTDGLGSYRFAVAHGFEDVDYAMLVKHYGKDEDGRDVVIGFEKKRILGNPDMEKVSTSYIERANLTLRMGSRRFTRLTNAFSKKVENHVHAVSLHFMYYNFCRKHMTLKTTPAVAAGVANKIWTIEDLVEMHDNYWSEIHPVNRPVRYQKPRTTPKTYEPKAPETPWYLDEAAAKAAREAENSK